MDAPCPLCEPYGGDWAEGAGGLRRCGCARGQALAAADRHRAQVEATRAQKQSDRAKKKREEQRQAWVAQRRASDALAKRYRDLPLLD